MLGLRSYFIHKANKVRISKGYLHSNTSHLMLFMSDIYRYVQILICNVSGDISSFKLLGALYTNSVILRKTYTWDTLDIDWSEIKMLGNN